MVYQKLLLYLYYNTNKMDSFKSQLVNDLVPRVEELLEKEREHLRFLVKSKREFHKNNMSLTDINQMIDCSESLVKHYEVRIKQYNEYANK